MLCRAGNFVDMKFLLYLQLDSYHKDIDDEIIIETLCAGMHASHMTSIYENLLRKLFRQ